MTLLMPEYHAPSEREFDELFNEGIVSVDANVLLNLYEYTDATRRRVLEVLQHFSSTGQLWLSNQVAEEYQRNRASRIIGQNEEFQALKKVLESQQSSLQEALKPHMRYEHTGVEHVHKSVVNAFTKAIQKIETARTDTPPWFENDSVLLSLDLVIGEHVTPVWSDADRTEATTEAKRRMDKKIPPGFEDADKSEPYRYGDYFLWRQLLDLAHEQRSPLLLITDDDKDDWWWRVKGRTIGPRPELCREFRTIVERPFYMYGTKRFVEWTLQRLKLPEDTAAITELAEVQREADERYRRRTTEEDAAYSAALASIRNLQDRKQSLIALRQALEEHASRLRKDALSLPPGDELARCLATVHASEARIAAIAAESDSVDREAMLARANLTAAETRLEVTRAILRAAEECDESPM